jgi:hypothetical protein
LSFQDTSSKVLGPIEFEDGTYRVTATTDDYFSAEVQTVSGNCEILGGFQLLFSLSQGEGNSGAEAVLTSQNCVALIGVENSDSVMSI